MHIPVTIAVICFSILTSSCKKESNTVIAIYKTWQWQNSIGGFSGNDTIQPSTNTVVTLTFKRNLTYTTSMNGQTLSGGSFTISKINDQVILYPQNFTASGGLFLCNNGGVMTAANNMLQLQDYNISESYTHNFR